MTIELNGKFMTDRATTHNYLQHQLHLPKYYGKNLDALYDLLTECAEPVQIKVNHIDDMEEQLGNYAVVLLATLREAAENNPALEVEIGE